MYKLQPQDSSNPVFAGSIPEALLSKAILTPTGAVGGCRDAEQLQSVNVTVKVY